jgi:hypothetical protein
VRVLFLVIVGGLFVAYGIFGMLAQTVGNFLVAGAFLAVGVFLLWLASRANRTETSG